MALKMDLGCFNVLCFQNQRQATVGDIGIVHAYLNIVSFNYLPDHDLLKALC